MIALKIDLQCKQYKHLHTTPGYTLVMVMLLPFLMALDTI